MSAVIIPADVLTEPVLLAILTPSKLSVTVKVPR
jgi:hypothetical protein